MFQAENTSLDLELADLTQWLSAQLDSSLLSFVDFPPGTVLGTFFFGVTSAVSRLLIGRKSRTSRIKSILKKRRSVLSLTLVAVSFVTGVWKTTQRSVNEVTRGLKTERLQQPRHGDHAHVAEEQ